jgi:transcriptional regulator GlxA family with amidase domain
MRHHLGMTPTAFVSRIRMDRAAQLLEGKDLPIPEVAAATGIENLVHFYRLFGRHHGASPRAYRLHRQRDPFGAA